MITFASAVHGRWIGTETSRSGMAIGFRAGLMVTVCDGTTVLGPPQNFVSDQGLPGDQIIDSVVLPPYVADLKLGAIREAIASISDIARYGFMESRAWDGPSDYVVDNGEGDRAVVRFSNRGCFGAFVSNDPSR